LNEGLQMKEHRYVVPWYFLFLLSLLLPSGCQQKMADQPSYRPDDANSFFADGRADRPLVPGTIARGHLRTDLHLFTGKRTRQAAEWAFPASLIGAAAGQILNAVNLTALEESNYVETFPFPITRRVLERGQERYGIYCMVCHDPVGTGHGPIVQRGYTQPPSYHVDRLRRVAVGHIFDVITNGYGSMPDYKQQIEPRDRWAIVAYILALQLSRHFPVRDLPEDVRKKLEKERQSAMAERRLE
jgi:mono/diheme cytochrome c family protein